MRFGWVLLGLLVWGSIANPLLATGKKEPDDPLVQVIRKLNRQSVDDVDSPRVLLDLIRREYSTSDTELKWALSRSIGWGDILALAHIQAATGRTFAEMTAEDASKDFGAYAEKAGMSRDKMSRSLASFLKEAERTRNTQIFERLRTTRRISSLPDVGSGFGLFQESLDFRYIDVSRPTKIH